MMRTPLLALAATIGLMGPGPGHTLAAEGSARAAALEALASKADLPAGRPLLPSLLTDPDARMAMLSPGAGASDSGNGKDNGNGKGNGKSTAPGQLKKEAKADIASAQAAAANDEAVLAASQASADAQDAAEKSHEKKTREKNPKKPHPPKGGGK
jgi:hypothetical protein